MIAVAWTVEKFVKVGKGEEEKKEERRKRKEERSNEEEGFCKEGSESKACAIFLEDEEEKEVI